MILIGYYLCRTSGWGNEYNTLVFNFLLLFINDFDMWMSFTVCAADMRL